MTEVDNISFVEYINLGDKSYYNYILKYSNLLTKPLDIYSIGDIINESYGFVKDLQEILNYDGLTWEKLFTFMEDQRGIKQKDIARKGLFDLQRFRVYLKEQVDTVNELESISLGHEPTIKEQAAGLERFAIFRSFPQTDKLCKGDITKIPEVKKMPYLTAFTKLSYDARQLEYKNDYQRINKG